MGLFGKKKSLPELPKPEAQYSRNKGSDNIKLPEFPSNSDFPMYESISKDITSIKRAVNPKSEPAMAPIMHYEEPRTAILKPAGKALEDKTLFVKIENYEATMNSIEKLKERIHSIDSTISAIEKLKHQEDTELENWRRDIEALKEKLMLIESRLLKA